MKLIAEKYRLERCVGQGGTGRVYAATHLELERTVAIKLLRPDLAADPISRERFRQAAGAAARLNHPNVMTTYDFGVLPDGVAYTVMELLEGPTLRQYMQDRERLPFAKSVQIAHQIATAIAAAHRYRIVHGDLTPSNIILTHTAEGHLQCKVVDFGIARIGDIARAETAFIIGTPRYMSPEQYAGAEIDARSDIFSLGVILYEMLAGRPPFDGATPWDIVRQQRRPPPDLRGLRPEVPWRLVGLVARTLCVDPNARVQTADEIASELKFAQSHVGVFQLPVREPAQIIEAFPPHNADEDTIELDEWPQALDERQGPTAPLFVLPAPQSASTIGKRSQRLNRRVPQYKTAAAMVLVAGLLSLSHDRPARAPRQSVAALPQPAVATPWEAGAPGIPRQVVAHRAPSLSLPIATVHGVGATTAAETVAARAALSSALDGWIAATNARDLEGQLTYYPSSVDRFYLWHNVSREAVLAEKRRVFGRASLIDIKTAKPQISFDATGRTARMQFRKRYVIESEYADRRGEVIQELRWMKGEAGWKIVSERDIQVIS